MGRSTGVQFTVHYPKEETRANGEVETSWPAIGRAFEEEERIVIKLDSLPMQQYWKEAKLALYPVRGKGVK